MLVMLVIATLMVGVFLLGTGVVMLMKRRSLGFALSLLGALMCLNTFPFFIATTNSNRDRDIQACTDKGGRADIYGRNGEYVYCHLPN